MPQHKLPEGMALSERVLVRLRLQQVESIREDLAPGESVSSWIRGLIERSLRRRQAERSE